MLGCFFKNKSFDVVFTVYKEISVSQETTLVQFCLSLIFSSFVNSILLFSHFQNQCCVFAWYDSILHADAHFLCVAMFALQKCYELRFECENCALHSFKCNGCMRWFGLKQCLIIVTQQDDCIVPLTVIHVVTRQMSSQNKTVYSRSPRFRLRLCLKHVKISYQALTTDTPDLYTPVFCMKQQTLKDIIH